MGRPVKHRRAESVQPVCGSESRPWPCRQGRAGTHYLLSRACACPPGKGWPPCQPAEWASFPFSPPREGYRGPVASSSPQRFSLTEAGTPQSRGPRLSFQAGAHPGSCSGDLGPGSLAGLGGERPSPGELAASSGSVPRACAPRPPQMTDGAACLCCLHGVSSGLSFRQEGPRQTHTRTRTRAHTPAGRRGCAALRSLAGARAPVFPAPGRGLLWCRAGGVSPALAEPGAPISGDS